MSESIDSATDSNRTCSEAIGAVMAVRYSLAFSAVMLVDGYREKVRQRFRLSTYFVWLFLRKPQAF